MPSTTDQWWCARVSIMCGLVFLLSVVFLKPQVNAQNIESLKKGVVRIKGPRQSGMGIIVGLQDDKAYIATASSVIEGGQPLTVSFFSDPNQSFKAKVLGTEAGNLKGLAGLSIEGNLPAGIVALALDTQTPLTNGTGVSLIGIAGAFYSLKSHWWAITVGTIKGGIPPDLLFEGGATMRLIGGPLLLDGKVVGIVTGKVGDYGLAKPATVARIELGRWQMVFTVMPEPVIKKQAGTFRAVVAGVTNYKGGLISDPPLKLGEAAQLMQSLIHDLAVARGFELGKIKIKLLIGREDQPDEPTPTKFLESILAFSNASFPEDTLAVYFTGHGAKEYLYGSGADIDNKYRRIEFSELYQLISDSIAGTNLVFLDTCRVLNPITADGGESFSGFAESKQGDAWFYSASKGKPSYIDKQLGYGIYTKHLSAALASHHADGWKKDLGRPTNPKDGNVTASELNAFLQHEVQADVTKNISPTSRQVPRISVPGEFALYRYKPSLKKNP